MKIPLRYQISEYDCGPTSLLNAMSFLFQREEITPELIRNIMLYSLDSYGSGGVLGKSGTSRMAMAFLSNREEGLYALGREEDREAVLIFNQHTMLTPEKNIEYFI
jgi:hypothetical protein